MNLFHCHIPNISFITSLKKKIFTLSTYQFMITCYIINFMPGNFFTIYSLHPFKINKPFQHFFLSSEDTHSIRIVLGSNWICDSLLTSSYWQGNTYTYLPWDLNFCWWEWCSYHIPGVTGGNSLANIYCYRSWRGWFSLSIKRHHQNLIGCVHLKTKAAYWIKKKKKCGN